MSKIIRMESVIADTRKELKRLKEMNFMKSALLFRVNISYDVNNLNSREYYDLVGEEIGLSEVNEVCSLSKLSGFLYEELTRITNQEDNENYIYAGDYIIISISAIHSEPQFTEIQTKNGLETKSLGCYYDCTGFNETLVYKLQLGIDEPNAIDESIMVDDCVVSDDMATSENRR